MFEDFIKYLRRVSIPFSVTVICIYALYLRVVSLYNREFWTDELSQLQALQGTFWGLIKVVPTREFCSYLSGDFYLMFPFFKLFGYNKWGLVVPHIISTIIGFYLLYLICKRYFKSIWAYLITFGIVCFNNTLIFHATEIRPYAVLPTLALATFYLVQRMGDLNFKLDIYKRLWAIVLLIFVIWFHVYGLCMFMTSLLFVLLSKLKEPDFKNCLKNATYFTATLLCITMPLWLYSVFGPHCVAATFKQPTFEYIPSPIHNPIGFLKGIFCNLVGDKRLYILFLGFIVPFIFSYKERVKQLLFLFINILIPIFLIFISDFVSKYSFIQRQFIWVMPLFAFFLGWTWESFFMILRSRINRREPQ